MKLKKQHLKRILVFLIIIFIIVNVIAYAHAYKLTHFSTTKTTKTQSPDKLSLFEKVKTIFTGVNNPRPINNNVPTQPYETIYITGDKKLECWLIKNDTAKGTVVVFHGYGGHKSSMLDKADKFLNFGYNVLLVDFMGSGGSQGNQTTIGFKEAEQVNTAYDYLISKGETNIVLFGTFMGAVAIMKAANDYNIKPAAIILECPFGSMYATVSARFNNMHLPAFPMANLLVFWGGVQNGFWGFSHNPKAYATKITSPTLLLYGEKDKNVSREEIDEIYTNINAAKKLITYPLSGHENYLLKYDAEWTSDVHSFLISVK